MIESTFTDILPQNTTRTFRRRLLRWYEMNGRDLPWRRTQDPYRIWVSEIMLQQTQVSRVEEYYGRFITAFPTLETLAHSSLSQVLKMWEGLGYYSRARNLHRAASIIIESDHSRFPRTIDAFSALPGVGPYTAGAVMSIAFNQPYPALDGNVRRVLCRVFGIQGKPSERKTKQILLALAGRLLPVRQPASFNQALMELGALVCRPTTPHCSDCCLQPLCAAQKLPDPSSLPVREKKPRRVHYDVTAGVIRRGSRILLAQRYPEGLLGGMWEFPGGKKEPRESLEECLRREIREELGIDIAVDEPIGSVNHAYTHFQFTLHGFHCRYIGGKVRNLGCADWKWIRPAEISSYALPGADRKLLRLWDKERL